MNTHYVEGKEMKEMERREEQGREVKKKKRKGKEIGAEGNGETRRKRGNSGTGGKERLRRRIGDNVKKT